MMGDYRDDLAAAHARIDALEAERTDPSIPVFIEPETTARERLDAWNDRNAWVRWSALVVGLLIIAGAIVRACW